MALLVFDRRQARTIKARATAISDPAEKLRFLRQNTVPRTVTANRSDWRIAILLGALLLAAGVGALGHMNGTGRKRGVDISHPASHATGVGQPVPHVWLVERNGATEHYSNGLRIEIGLEQSTRPRTYLAVRRGEASFIRRTDPAGIVFHTTESELAPFDAEHNHALKAVGKDLLSYVRANASYHFVIDRFGRVYRMVSEADEARHAGHSVWADGEFAYLELNQSFLGISFEAQTEAVQSAQIAAQTIAARQLVEMLRSKYRIRQENCITHAQVSVNPSNMQLGYHTDWATRFPFRDLGLTNGYDSTVPAVSMFGFNYAQDFIDVLNGKMWPGLVRAEQDLVAEAAATGTTPTRHRKTLQQKYRSTITAVRKYMAGKEAH